MLQVNAMMSVAWIAFLVSLASPAWPTAPAAGEPGVLSNAVSTPVRAVMTARGQGLTRSITISEYGETGVRIVRYDEDMERRMHLVVISGDFTAFMHLHPVLGPDGVFRLDVRFPRAGLYHMYADAAPHGLGHPVFRFDVRVGAAPSLPPSLGDPSDEAVASPYRVHLSADAITAGVATPVLIVVTKDGKPASDLHPYLGAYAHIVAIGSRDLSYTHVHAMSPKMQMPGDMDMEHSMAAPAIVPPTMRANVLLPRPGSYKVWVQFMGGGAMRVASFVVTAR